MELRNLKAFTEVAGNGGYARAAGTLGIAQSVLSRQVSALEREIGGRLFHRTGRGVVLTECGERLLPRARALVADATAFAEAAKSKGSRPTGEVNLGVVPVAAQSLIAVLAGQLRNTYPDIRLRALEGYSGQIEEWLAAGRIEIGIFNRYRRGRVANAEPLMHADMHVITRGDHPVARKREITLRELADVPLALPAPPNSLTSLLIGLAASQHFALTIKFESGSTLLTKEAIVASDLATISPPDVFTPEIKARVFAATRIVRPGIAQTTWMSLSAQRPPSEAVRVVARLIREQTAMKR